VELERQGSRVLLRVNARTQRQGDWIHSRIEIELRVVASGSARSVVVLRRTELGA
jgi:hypothetical protein